jgi:hypothetical protein
MSLIFDFEERIKSNTLVGGENSEIRNFDSDGDANDLSHLSREANELLMRLNELANGYPFNIIYRAKINDPR